MDYRDLGLSLSPAAADARPVDLSELRERIWNAAQRLDSLNVPLDSVVSSRAQSLHTSLSELESTIHIAEQLASEEAAEERSRQEVYLLLGTAHWMMGEFVRALGEDDAQATVHYGRACERFEKVPPALLMSDEDGARYYPWALARTGRRGEAVAFLRSIDSCEVLSARVLFEFALFLQSCGDIENANGMLAATVKCATKEQDGQLELGNALESAGHPEAAVQVYLAGARHLFGSRRWSDALEACDRTLLVKPKQSEARGWRLAILLRTGRIEEAIPDLYYLASSVAGSSYRIVLSRALIRTGRAQEAFTTLTEVLASEPGNTDARCLLAEANNRIGNCEIALKITTDVLFEHPQMTEALLQKALALSGLQEMEGATEVIDELLARDPANVQALMVKLGLLLKRKLWEEVVELATKVVDGGLGTPRDAATAYLHRGAALLEMKVLAEARKDLERVWDTAPVNAQTNRLLLRTLRELGQWQEVIDFLDRVMEKLPKEPEWILAKVDALRRLGRQDEALQVLGLMPDANTGAEFIRLKAALLCDIGDFEAALELLLPATTPIDKAEHVLLALRGWAHQNCIDDAHAVEAERVYRQVLVLDPADRWSRKGLANALRRLGRTDEANEKYADVIRAAEELKAQDALNPYDSCLVGWCYYCTGRFKEGADACAAGLAAVGIGIAAQLDYGLILLADSCFAAARAQYERSIWDAETKNPGRRCGLLYVALFDLHDGVRRHENVAQAAETYEIQTMLGQALRRAIRNLGEGLDRLARHIEAYVQMSEHQAASATARLAPISPAPATEVDWKGYRVAGFLIANWSQPCALCMPIVGAVENPGVLFSISDSGAALGQRLGNDTAADTTVRFRSSYPAAASSRILWVSKALLEAVGPDARKSSGEELPWEEILLPIPSWAGITIRPVALRLLDQWAYQLVCKSVERLAENFRKGAAEKLAEAVIAADYALGAAQDETILYQAVLARGAAGGDVSEGALRAIRPGESHPSLGDAAALDRSIQEFKKLTRLQNCLQTFPDACEKRQKPGPLTSDNEVIQHIFDRAHAISQIENTEEQNRSAMQASAEMQLLVPLTGTRKPLYDRLFESLNSQDRFYLENDESILLMSREPPFYTSSVLLPLSRPAIRSVDFLKAARRMEKLEMAGPADTLYRSLLARA